MRTLVFFIFLANCGLAYGVCSLDGFTTPSEALTRALRVGKNADSGQLKYYDGARRANSELATAEVSGDPSAIRSARKKAITQNKLLSEELYALGDNAGTIRHGRLAAKSLGDQVDDVLKKYNSKGGVPKGRDLEDVQEYLTDLKLVNTRSGDIEGAVEATERSLSIRVRAATGSTDKQTIDGQVNIERIEEFKRARDTAKRGSAPDVESDVEAYISWAIRRINSSDYAAAIGRNIRFQDSWRAEVSRIETYANELRRSVQQAIERQQGI